MTAPAVASPSTPEALAEALRIWFPEIAGRAVAVSDMTDLDETQPALPLMLVASVSDEVQSYANDLPRDMREELVVFLWQTSARFERADGSGESRIHRHYDHRRVRDHLIANLDGWETPDGGVIRYRGFALELMHGEATVSFVFRLRHEYRWCPPAPSEAPRPIEIAFMAGPKPRVPCPPPCDPPPCAPCDIPVARPE